MKCRGPYLITLMVLGIGLVQGQSLRDTIEVGYLIGEAKAHRAVWNLDSANWYANQALQHLREIIATPHRPEDQQQLLSYKARCLELIGKSAISDAAIDTLRQASELYTQVGQELMAVQMESAIANVHVRNGRYAEALQVYHVVLRRYRELGEAPLEAHTENDMGYLYRMTGQHASALAAHLRALPLIEQHGNSDDLGYCYILVGAVHRAKGDPLKAQEYFRKAQQVYEANGIQRGLSTAFNDLGSINTMLDRQDSAAYWHRRALALRTSLGDLNGMGVSNLYLGSIASKAGDLAAAREHFNASVEMFGAVPNPDGVANAHSHLAEVALKQGDHQAVLSHMDEAVRLREGLMETANQAALHLRYAGMLGQMGKQVEAGRHLQHSIELAKGNGHFHTLARAYQVQFDASRSQGQIMQAFQHHRNFLQARDSVLGRNKNAKAAQLMLQYEVQAVEMRQATLDAELVAKRELELDRKTRQRGYYIASGSLLSILALTLAGGVYTSGRSRKRLQRQRKALQRAKQRAEHSELFKERFLANMSHEVRTPMNAIMGMNTILLRNKHLPAQEVYLHGMSKNAEDLLGTINDILDLSKLEAEKLELEHQPFYLVALVKDCAQAYQGRANAKSIWLKTDLSDVLPQAVVGDGYRYRQVLDRLLNNAIKFTDTGGVQLCIVSDGNDLDEVVVQATITDTGIGIPEDRLDSVFEDFRKAYEDPTRTRGGSGLGLALSKRLVELMGGHINVESTYGEGSSFCVTVPFHPAEETSSDPILHEDLLLHGLRVLLADDNEFNVMVAKDELEDAIPEVQVRVANNGLEAVELARNHVFDVVLMDVQMPEMNGYDAAQAIRQLDGPMAKAPIIAMTANHMESEAKRCLEAGMDDLVPKPFKTKELVDCISKQVASRK